ncbi:MAG: hypothetical protein M3Q58_15855, partial [Bacteroidota bacterium]|nr:hypothetical protein [Bacteroidota bacterium]
MKSIKFILGLLFLIQNPVFSQEKDALRVEIELKNSSENINIIPMNKKGMLLFYSNTEKDKSGN